MKVLPEWLKKHRFPELVKPCNTYKLPPPEYIMDLDTTLQMMNVDKVVAYAKEQAILLANVIKDTHFLIVLGGDCSILIGNAIALKQTGNYGLFFLDGHTDYIPSELSQTAAIAGMDLAIVTGFAHEKLTNIYNLAPYLDKSNVFCVGNREYGPDYVQPILESGIPYCDLDRLRANGQKNTAELFIDLVEKTIMMAFLFT
ncbi:arginase family protein [Galbibacter pacificus]|uniref:Arginase family protein n=1 Tax=Galbibacter pacificus TaxID=2996052 RepID=A0ABT6FR27_9FLAO|nr:arginase family protein [Galbibacter pacificus]MDG3581813.1 arginase family protein [Galbibacter pacificus]MDG3585713.1 arginase family protein [Galbibacter pacificus]